MNINERVGTRHPAEHGPGRKIKRVSDINAVPTSHVMSSGPFDEGNFGPPGSSGAHQQPYGMSQSTVQPSPPGGIGLDMFDANVQHEGHNYSYIPQQQQQQQQMQPPQAQFPGSTTYPSYSVPQQSTTQVGGPSTIPFPNQMSGKSAPVGGMPNNPNIPPQFAVFQQPMVQGLALKYGQELADQGKQLVESHFERWIPVTRLKYYFAVDNKYVINKLRLLFFPFTHKDWSLKYDQENPVQPRHDVNAPDLYIPTMAYITFVLLAGLVLGMQNRFTPEQLGIQASSALAYSIFELVVYSITLYVANIPTNLKTLDLVAYSGYKFVIIVACILVGIIFFQSGYYIALIYCNFSLGFFLLRTLKTKVLHDPAPTTPAGGITYDPYSASKQTHQFDYAVGRKRKLYFLLSVVGFQVFLTFWLTKHLTLSGVPTVSSNPDSH